MPHQHQCRSCEKFFVCSEDAAECFARFVTCDDCFWRVDFLRFVFCALLLAVAIWLTTFAAGNWKKIMPSVLKTEISLSHERCACGHRRIAHVHYNGGLGIPEGEPTYCYYPDYDGDGKTIYCLCEKYEKADE